jgi:opacity protein-like surface antigen
MRNKLLLAVLLVVAAQAAVIHAAEPGAVIRLHGVYLDGSAVAPSLRPGAPMYTIEDGAGIELGFGYRLSRRLGIGISGAVSDFDVDPFFPYPTSGEFAEDLRVQQLTLALEIHLTPGSRFDLYLAPTFNYLRFDDLKASPAVGIGFARRQLDDDSTWGLTLGFELPLGDAGWTFSGGLRYVAAQLYDAATFRDGLPDAIGVDEEFDLGSIAVGVAYRF